MAQMTLGMCQDMDFSEKYELGLEEKSLRTFPRISLSNSECESEGLRKPMRRSEEGPKVPRVGRASVYLVRAGTKWNTCA